MGEAAERAGQTGREPRSGTQTGSGLQGGANHQTQHCGEGLFRLNPLPTFPLGWHKRKQRLHPEIPVQEEARSRALCDNAACSDLQRGLCYASRLRNRVCGFVVGILGVKNILGLSPLAPPAAGRRGTFFSQNQAIRLHVSHGREESRSSSGLKRGTAQVSLSSFRI